jgi:hypothetical protein
MRNLLRVWERALGIVAAVVVTGVAVVFGPVPLGLSEPVPASSAGRGAFGATLQSKAPGSSPIGFGLPMGPGAPYEVVEQGCADAVPSTFFDGLEAEARKSGLVPGDPSAVDAGHGMYWRQEHGDLVVLSRLRTNADTNGQTAPALTLTFGHRSNDCGTQWQTLARRAAAPVEVTPAAHRAADDGVPMPPFAHELFRGAGVGAAGLRLYGTTEPPARIAAWFREAMREVWQEQPFAPPPGRSAGDILWFTQDGRYCLISIDASARDETTVVVMIGAESRRLR